VANASAFSNNGDLSLMKTTHPEPESPAQDAPQGRQTGFPRVFTNTAAVALSLFTLYTAVFGMINALQFRSLHLLLAFIITFLIYPASKRYADNLPWWDYIIVGIVVFATGYFVVMGEELTNRIFFVTPLTGMQYITSSVIILLLLEATRRVAGLTLPIITAIFIIYVFVGPYLPPDIGHPGSSLSEILEQLTMTSDGIFGRVLGIVATYVAIFVLLAAFLDLSGTGKFFIDMAIGLTGRTRGGPAKAAVLGSGLMGSISGSAVANVITTGTFTIPMMIRIGYRPRFAGAVEAVASTGGQLMPPVMAAVSFIMADFLGVPYLRVVKAALIPAFLYYFSVFMMVDAEAVKGGIRGLSKDELPLLSQVLTKWYLSVPLVAVIIALVLGYTPLAAGLYAWYCTLGIIALNWLLSLSSSTSERIRPKLLLEAMQQGSKNLVSVSVTCACAGVIVGVIVLTGLGLKITGLVLMLAGGSLVMALLMTMLSCMVLGMGLPTIPAYLVSVALVAPALVELGVLPIVAHMFVLYFAVISCITPPVAIAAFAASPICKANPMEVGWEAMRLAIAAYLVPFAFVYQPAMLLEGSATATIFSVVSAGLGIVGLAWAIVGFAIVSLRMLERLALGVGALFLIAPGIVTDISGLFLYSLVFFIQRRRHGLNVKSKQVLAGGD
jgi:TRAP transporter 4TM/12TM fusion protein